MAANGSDITENICGDAKRGYKMMCLSKEQVWNRDKCRREFIKQLHIMKLGLPYCYY